MVPKPFARVIIRFGEAIDVPAGLDSKAFEQKRLFIEQRMKDLYADTDQSWADAGQIEAVFRK